MAQSLRLTDRLLGKLSRVTSSGRFIPEIDGLRFLAIALVVTFHIDAEVRTKSPVALPGVAEHDLLARFLNHGFIGVQLFFAISGFILSMPFAAHYLRGGSRPSLKAYYLRRVTRLEPPYLINLLFCFILEVALVGKAFGLLFPHLLASMVYLHNLTFEKASLINGVAWSLEIEVQFYLLAPLFARLFGIQNATRRRLAFISMGAAAAALTLLLDFLGAPPFYVHQATLLGQFQYFIVGFLLADFYLTDWDRCPVLGRKWDLVGTASLVGLYLCIDQDWRQALFVPIFMFFFYVSAFRGPLCNRIFRNRWLATIGGMCYTIYLYHFPIISMVEKKTMRRVVTSHYAINDLFQIAVMSVAILAICSVLFLLFEKPFMVWRWRSRHEVSESASPHPEKQLS